jgi:ATP-dependent Zn protease
MNRLSRIVLAGGIVALAVLPACSLLGEKTTPERVPYSTFQKYLETNQVKEASVGPDQIEATLSNGQTIVTTRVPADIAAELGGAGSSSPAKPGWKAARSIGSSGWFRS